MKTLTVVLSVVVSLGFSPAIAQTPRHDHHQIENVVVIFQENRTPDNLLHGLPDADIANSGINSKGESITLQPVPLANNYDLSHAHTAFVQMYDNGRMDGADKVAVMCQKGAQGCPIPNPQFSYVGNPSDVARLTFKWPSSLLSRIECSKPTRTPDFPAHQFIISGTSAPSQFSDLFASENPGGVSKALNNTGCTAPANEVVKVIDPSGSENQGLSVFWSPDSDRPARLQRRVMAVLHPQPARSGPGRTPSNIYVSVMIGTMSF